MTALKKNTANLLSWLDSASRSQTPSGYPTNIVRVNPGETVEVVVSGGQHFGSGGFSASSSYAGDEPEFVEDCGEFRDSFIHKSTTRFRMKPSSVLHQHEGDDIGEGRHWRTTYVCATDDAIAAAVETMKPVHEVRAQQEADQEKAKRKQFAREQHERLVTMGFNPKVAARIMHAAGPGRAVAAVEWAYQALETVNSVDALDCLLCGQGGTHGFGKDRMMASLRAFGIEPPEVYSARALDAILRGAHAALLAGLPVRETV